MSLPGGGRLRAMGLRVRMGLVAGLAVAIAVLAVAISSYLGTQSAVYGQIDSSLRSLSAQILHPRPVGDSDQDNAGKPKGNGAPSTAQGSPLSSLTGGTGSDCDQGLGINRPGQPFGGLQVFVQLLHANGTICRATGETVTIPTSARAHEVATSGTGSYFDNQTVQGVDIRLLVHGVRARGALMLAFPLTSADTTLDHELILMAVIAAAGIALAAVLGFLVARAAVAPITSFTRRTESIAHNVNQLERERLEVTGSDELARLALTFNETLDALEASIDAQRNLVADASHELRTPIATLRANLQLLREEGRLPPEEREALRRDMIDELDELTNLVSDVVELARGTKASQQPDDVRLEDIVGAALERARRRGPKLEFRAALEPTVIHGDGERIARAVNNLLDNAIKWGPSGSAVEVGLRDGVLSVRDHGPGFHPEDLPFVFDRFHRARDARSKPGSGLGLAIVRQAAESHGGFVEAANAPDGGALMRVSFGPPVVTDDPGRAVGPAALAG
ncbi:MAG TPA: HAMP domain-containing sensor histidine kinase [Solirubrobacteraceae bacterium]|nr:HAMP domain-containing sensor histidine kinase [Solirubrobacteraceae bacterium]